MPSTDIFQEEAQDCAAHVPSKALDHVMRSSMSEVTEINRGLLQCKGHCTIRDLFTYLNSRCIAQNLITVPLVSSAQYQ